MADGPIVVNPEADVEQDLAYAGTAPVKRAVIVSPTSAGSLGDQAMLDAVVGHLSDRAGYDVRIVPNDHVTRAVPEGRNPATGMGKLASSVAAVARADFVGFIGADVLDGVYGADGVMKRMRLMQLANALGKKTRVFGASFSRTPSDRMVAFLRNATWLEVFARDPISRERMLRATGCEAPLVADLAFSIEPDITSAAAAAAADWIRARREEGHTVIGVNFGGPATWADSEALHAGLVTAISSWLDADAARSILLVPHDLRPGRTGDVQSIAEIGAALLERFVDRVRAVSGPIQAWDAKALAGMLDLVLVSRMHLAIAALGMGVPSLCMVYQGKFEGVLSYFDLDACVIEPAACLEPARLTAALERVLSDAPALRARIAAALPRVRDLSRANFAGL